MAIINKNSTGVIGHSGGQFKSFKLSKEAAPFVSFKFTEQTIYWSILLLLILILALWVLQLQINLNEVMNSINKV